MLEHPDGSYAWARMCLPFPARGGWAQSFLDKGYVTEVAQARYGHEARKRTWLYYVGPEPPALDWREAKGTRALENMNSHNGEASRTTQAFRDVLLDMARSASKVVA